MITLLGNFVKITKLNAFKKTNDNHRGRNEKVKKEFREHKKQAEIMEMEDLQEKCWKKQR